MKKETIVNIFWALFMISCFLFMLNVIASVTLKEISLSWLISWAFTCWLTVIYAALFPHALRRDKVL